MVVASFVQERYQEGEPITIYSDVTIDFLQGKPKITIPEKCTDSDGGKNYYVKGSITFTTSEYPDRYHISTDSCCDNEDCSGRTSEAGPTVLEYFCDNGKYRRVPFKCPNGCQDGACLKAPVVSNCTDSDGGLNYYVRGKGQRG